MPEFNALDTRFFYDTLGTLPDSPPPFSGENAHLPLIIWAHGWGQNRNAFLKIVEPFKERARHILLDLPGFGQSPPPPDNWGTEDYARAVALWLKKNNAPPIIWVGHSFGCRVGIRLAALYPERIANLCLIAGAGLKRKRPLHKKIYFFLRIRLFKLLKHLLPAGNLKDRVMAYFGSADYKNAGAMKTIFIRTVNEDLSTIAPQVKCPVTLIYGENDTETPPEFGQRYARLMPDAKFVVLNGQDHYSVLSEGRHPVVKILDQLITKQTQAISA